MNKWIGHGNVGGDPEIKTIGENKVAKFSLATNKTFTKASGEKETRTEWHNIILWGKLAELAQKYVTKGSQLIIEGEISYRSYENKDGNTIYVTDIIGNALHFTGSKKEEAPQKATDTPRGKQHTGAMSDINELPQHVKDAENVPDELDMPF